MSILDIIWGCVLFLIVPVAILMLIEKIRKWRNKKLITKFVDSLRKDWRGMTWEGVLDHIDELIDMWEEFL